jgi:hypothetical protein
LKFQKKKELAKFKIFMPKAIDLRLKGVSFEDAMKRFIASPPMPSSKKGKQSAASKPKRAKR